MVSLLDLTSLGQDDTADDVRSLCAAADSPLGLPAAVCVWPRFVGVAAEALAARGLAVRVAAVANFPAGAPDPAAAGAETANALECGAHEVDVVFPWRSFLRGDRGAGERLVAACRRECDRAGGERGTSKANGEKLHAPVLKVILETGELVDPGTIMEAARVAADQGADFLKTSTGKVPVGATPGAVRALLGVIREREGSLGLKISGGVGTVDQAQGYLELVEEVMGEDWISPARVRFGASRLLEDILDKAARLPEGMVPSPGDSSVPERAREGDRGGVQEP
jgi:deoxyribose-phosphate aldolase